jgi:hypothetical protein
VVTFVCATAGADRSSARAAKATSETLILTGIALRVDKKRTKREIAPVRGVALFSGDQEGAAADKMCHRNGKSVTASPVRETVFAQVKFSLIL